MQKLKRVSLMLPPTQLNELDEFSKKLEKTKSDIIRDAIRYHLNKLRMEEFDRLIIKK